MAENDMPHKDNTNRIVLEKGHKSITTESTSAFTNYRKVIIGSLSFSRLLKYELCCFVSPFRGALGFVLRNILWARLFGSCGKGSQFGSNITLMHPHRIFIGRKNIFGDNCILDARTPDFDCVIKLEDNVMLSHGVMLSAIGGTINIASRTGLGAYTIVRSSKGNPVTIGNDVGIGPQCYIAGGGNYNTSRLDIPITQQGHKIMGGSHIEDGVWLGAQACILGGVTVGRDSIVGAGAVVTKSIPPRSIALGVPAKVVGTRE